MSLYDGEDGSVSLAAGTWSSLHSRTDAGFDGAPGIFYETDFYAGLGFGFAGGWGADVTYTAYMSPRGSWGTVREVAVGLSHDDIIAPYITLAFEIDGSAAGDNSGTYLELGIEPSLPLDDAPVGVSFPIAVGLSPSDYYDPGGVNEAFGFFNVGAMLGVPHHGHSGVVRLVGVHGRHQPAVLRRWVEGHQREHRRLRADRHLRHQPRLLARRLAAEAASGVRYCEP